MTWVALPMPQPLGVHARWGLLPTQQLPGLLQVFDSLTLTYPGAGTQGYGAGYKALKAS
jgi:hypothetical protein